MYRRLRLERCKNRMTPPRTYLGLARMIYRRAMAPPGRLKLRRMLGDGLPQAFQYPLEFLFFKSLSQADHQVVSKIESIREAVARQSSSFELTNRDGKLYQLSASQIAHQVSVNSEWGTFLYLCSRSFRARTILELGSCVGISGCYLASSEYCERLITVEASPESASLARTNISQVSHHAEVVNALFDDALDSILPTLEGGIDLAFIDGHHKYEPTLHYFQRLEPHLNKSALVIFDDIHLSEGMWQAWQVLKGREGFASTIDAGRFGLCIWDGPSSIPSTYNLAPYLGWLWKVSPPGPPLVPVSLEI
jgi:predicted O-methyltransferase YrrM